MASTWVHFDVRQFEVQYLEDRYFKKTQEELEGRPMVELAEEAEYTIECSCSNSGGEVPAEQAPAAASGDRVPASTLQFSQAGVDFVKGWESTHIEGGKHTLYDDDSDYCTIGYGHLVSGKRSCASIPNISAEFRAGLTEAQAEELYRADKAIYVSLIQDTVTADLYQHEFDALVSLTFNIGGPDWRTSTIRRLINAEDYTNAAEEFARWKYSGGVELRGLVLRRAAERDIFLNNHYDSTH